ncbi:LysR family transcriptional regulator [Acuticoccus kandeliae]|uniref:LysR family transcriptional regulator n=1 Tax=Acuticoccus kandeliae TaxID=2073160 RepID=UPI000D3E77DA|nr:LysR family transcriptional regulator [Acuticoccus kandeliae]
MPLSSSRVRALNAVVEEGGYSAAARRLGVSQPAITQHIRELQAEFDVVLFDRTPTGLVPTALCRDLYRITSAISQREDDALLLLRQAQEFDRGELRVGLGNAMPGMRLIGSFQRRYPGVRVHVEMGSFQKIMEAVVEQRVDVGVLPDVPDDGRFRRIVCARQDVVAIVHPSDPLAERTAVRLAELMPHRLIFRDRTSRMQRTLDAAIAAAGLDPRPSMVLDTRDGVLEAVANGLGVGFIWRHGSSREDRMHRLTVVELAAKIDEHVFHLANPVPRIAPHFMSVVGAENLP